MPTHEDTILGFVAGSLGFLARSPDSPRVSLSIFEREKGLTNADKNHGALGLAEEI
jgi:hypothetical protein